MSDKQIGGSELNWRQAKFVSEFVVNGNATDAAKAAGYAHPKQQGSRLLTHAVVKVAIEAHKRQLMVQAVDETDWLLDRLKVEALDPENGESTRVRALEVMGRIYGSYAPEKQQIEAVSSGFFADLSADDDETPAGDNIIPFASGT